MTENKVSAESIGNKSAQRGEIGSWAAKLSGRRVDFKSEEGLSWGIEVTLPIDSFLRKELSVRLGIAIPPEIKTIKYLDLAPQEALYPKDRNIQTNSFRWQNRLLSIASKTTSNPWLEKITAVFAERPADVRRRWAVIDLFQNVFGNNLEQIDKFNQRLSSSDGSEIAIVAGHGGGEPWVIGEQTSGVISERDRDFQKEGNDVSPEQILEKYDKPDLYSAILFVACFTGEQKLPKSKVPVFRGVGKLAGIHSLFNLNGTESSLPSDLEDKVPEL